MTTNILSLPLAGLEISTGTNEDWIDAVEYVMDDGTASPPQLDLRGIKFWIQVRAAADDPQVVIEGSTDDDTLLIGTYPEYGFLIFNVLEARMRGILPGNYVGDVVAMADGYTRVTLQIAMTIVEGVTREPFLRTPSQVLLVPVAPVNTP
jgi:hypothetical protein